MSDTHSNPNTHPTPYAHPNPYANTYANPNPRIFPRKDAWEDSWDLGVSVTWTLWNGGRTAAQVAEVTLRNNGEVLRSTASGSTPMAALNIVFMHAHNTGRYIQPYGHNVPTPNLQRLAEQGIVHGFSVTIVDALIENGEAVSSTRIRAASRCPGFRNRWPGLSGVSRRVRRDEH